MSLNSTIPGNATAWILRLSLILRLIVPVAAGAQQITPIGPRHITLRGIAATPNGRLFCVGDSGVVMTPVIFIPSNGHFRPGGYGLGTIEANISPLITLYAVAFADSSHIVIAGSQGTMSRSGNLGVNWVPVKLGTQNTIRAIVNNGNGVLIAVGDSGMMLRSMDKGVHWTTIPLGTQKQLNAISFGNPAVGVVVGNDTAIFQTVDSGKSWVPVAFPYTSLPAMVRHIDFPAVAMGGPDTIIVSPVRPVLPLYIIRGSVDPRGVDPDSTFRAQPFSGPVYGIVHNTNNSALTPTTTILRGDDYSCTDKKGQQHWTRGWVTWGWDADGNQNIASWRFCAGAAANGTIYQVGEDCRAVSTYNGYSLVNPIGMMDFLDISFPTSGMNGYTFDESGIVQLTSDGGRTWLPCDSVASSAGSNSNSIYSDGKSLVMVCGWAGSISRSTDSGKTFTHPVSHTTERLHGMAFPSPKIGVIVGDFGYISRSTNAGVTWTPVATTTPSFLESLAFLDSNIGVAGGSDGTILRTSDGGQSWNDINNVMSGTQSVVRRLQVLDSKTILAQATSDLLISTDAGLNWSSLHSPGDSLGMGFYNRQIGVVATSASSSAVAFDTVFLSHTTDGGAHWMPFVVPMHNANHVLVHWLNDHQVLLFAYESYVVEVDFSSGAVHTTVLSGAPQFEVHPNPLTNNTIVSFTSEQSSPAEVSIFDLLGNKVATLFSGELGVGEHSFTWDARGLPPGMYECVVRMNGQRLQRVPMMIQR